MKYKYTYIKEYLNFHQTYGNNNTIKSSMFVIDNTLSLNPYDRYKHDVEETIKKIKYLNKMIIGDFDGVNAILKEYDLKIRKIKIIKMVKNNSGDYDVYIKINYMNDDEDYYHWGVINNLISKNPHFKSDVLNSHIKDRNIISKVRGGILKSIYEWITPKPGYYELLNDYVICYNVNTGKEVILKKGDIIKVVTSNIENQKIIYNNVECKLDKDTTVYFNWYFKKINK